MRLHICRRSPDQVSIGPKAVEAQSILRANCMWLGIESEVGNRVQSKEGASEATSSIGDAGRGGVVTVCAFDISMGVTTSASEDDRLLGWSWIDVLLVTGRSVDDKGCSVVGTAPSGDLLELKDMRASTRATAST